MPSVKRTQLKWKFNVGNAAKISRLEPVFSKGYMINWSKEIFKTTERFRHTQWLIVCDLADEVVKGKFCEHEFQTNTDDEYVVGNILYT